MEANRNPHEELLSHMIILPNNKEISLIKNSLFADLARKPPITKALAKKEQYSRGKLKTNFKQNFKNHTKIYLGTFLYFAFNAAVGSLEI